MDRILDFADGAARLSVRLDQLVIERPEDEKLRTIPLCEIAALVISHQQVSMTHAVLEGLARHGGALVVCDGAHTPAGLMLPLAAHSTHAERLTQQITAGAPLKKRLWQGIVRAKIMAQAALLQETRGDDAGLPALARAVKSGDAGNLESQAARRYWPLLFDDPDFRRRRDGPAPNALLNYGYAVLRAIVARAVCASGLHPALGLHHRNRYNAFALADDLMEPFRPAVAGL